MLKGLQSNIENDAACKNAGISNVIVMPVEATTNAHNVLKMKIACIETDAISECKNCIMKHVPVENSYIEFGTAWDPYCAKLFVPKHKKQSVLHTRHTNFLKKCILLGVLIFSIWFIESKKTV